MNERTLRFGNVASAAVLIGGVLLLAVPRFGMSIVQLVIVTVAAAAALHALSVHVPPSGWLSPFRWMSPFVTKRSRREEAGRVDEITAIREKLDRRRQPIDGGPSLPTDVLLALQSLLRAALDLKDDEPGELGTARRSVSPLAWAILTAEPVRDPGWLSTEHPDARAVAETVHRVLDEIERLAAGGELPSQSTHPHHPRAS